MNPLATPHQKILEQCLRGLIEHNIENEKTLNHFKKQFAKIHAIPTPSNVQLMKVYRSLKERQEITDMNGLAGLLQKRKIRSLAGVSVITVLTKPFYCPGKCVFCPTEQGMPKSYLSNEPGAMRAVLADFDPIRQVKTRLNSLKNQGHPTDKIELIVLGGTFSAYKHAYQTAFIRQLYNALNEKSSRSLHKAQTINETANHRAIALSLETRPDHVTPKELGRFRSLGCTKVQIGLQCLDDEILTYNKRGETVEQGRQAIKFIRDAGFKFSVHMMPNLPGSTPEKDYDMMVKLFEDPAYKPDFLKLYPCVVVPYSELEHWWRRGEYQPYSDEVLTDLIIRIKKIVPEYVRIDRLIRDIPGDSILAGSLITNLRQMIENDRVLHGQWQCRCIRCREIRSDRVDQKNIVYKQNEFDAADGKEFFMTYEDAVQDKMLSLLRLRFPSYLYSGRRHFMLELEGAAVVREIHTYGFHVEIGKTREAAPQHVGLGRQLLQKAEKITKEAGIKKLAVTASIGTREYYRKWGYEREGTYMMKSLQ